jgi:CRISPR/Cas system CSM-associated protein Csm4 (group 5 of RAMP superfamily)
MPKDKKSMSKKELKKSEELPRIATDEEVGFVDEEPEEKTDIREIAKKAVEAKGVEATEQHITDYIERFNLS